MKKLHVVVSFAFLLLSGLSLLRADLLAAATSGLFAAGFFLSELTYQPASTSMTASALRQLPPWKRYTSMGLVVLALALVGYQIGRDLKVKQRASSQSAVR